MAAFGLPQLASLYDPSVAVDQTALDRNMAIAQALRQQAMTPIDTQGRQIGGMGYRISPLEGVAKALQAYQANKADTSNDAARLALTQRMAAALKGMDQGQGTPDSSGASQGGVSGGSMTGGSGPSMAALLRGGMVNDIGGPAMAGAYAKQFEPTDFERTLRSAGIDPASPLGRQMTQMQVAKLNNVPRESIRPGGYQRDPMSGEVQQFPTAVPGTQMVPDGQGGFTTRSVPGALPAIQAAGTAEAAGKAAMTPYAGVDASGQPKPVQSVASALGYTQSSPTIPPDIQRGRDADRGSILRSELAQETDPRNRAALQKELGALRDGPGGPSATYAAPPLGTEGAQKGLDTSWEALKAQNREAGNTKSYLQNIVTAAERGAIVGPGADRRELIQGMLQMAGVKEAVNTNAVDQKTLLDKYHDQIVTRLGQGGLGTDAARNMLDSAYPGSHMNVGAIREAAANLNGAQDMVQAKARLLQEPALKRDTTTYQQKEIAFDQAADPRLWQYKSIRDPAQKKAFAAQLMQQDPTIPQRIDALEKMGAW